MSTEELKSSLKDVVENQKHNFFIGKRDKGTVVGRSTTSKGNVIDFVLSTSGEVSYRVNGATSREINGKQDLKEAVTILSRVERMLQHSIKDMPDDAIIWAVASGDAGTGNNKKDKLYKRFGFKPVMSDPSSKRVWATVGELKKRSRRNDALRLDKKCGRSYIPNNATCRAGSGITSSEATALGVGALGAAGVLGAGAYLYANRQKALSGSSTPALRGSSAQRGPSPDPWNDPFTPRPPAPSSPPRPDTPRVLPGDRTTRRITGLTPKALLSPSRPKSKTQRMRENTAAAVAQAESAIAQTGREEVRRIAQIGNTMASAGEATGMTVKTTLRELRLRAEAARRRYEPGYRRGRPARRPQAPSQLPEGGGLPVRNQLRPTQQPPVREEVPINPTTGLPQQPYQRRRRARGFGRTDSAWHIYYNYA